MISSSSFFYTDRQARRLSYVGHDASCPYILFSTLFHSTLYAKLRFVSGRHKVCPYLFTYLSINLQDTIHEIRIWLLSSSLYTTYDIRNTLFYIGYFPSKQAKQKLSPGILSKTLHSPSILIWPKLSAPNHFLVSSKLWLAAHKSVLLGVSIP